MSATKLSFDSLRKALGNPRLPPPSLIANADQVKQMSPEDGLQQWVDGSAVRRPTAPSAPLLDAIHVQAAHLWVVRMDDVVHAPERGIFGMSLESGVIKHTNLTGGDAAFSGGELLFLDPQTVVVNGCSGRYGPRSAQELDSVVQAFASSGYGVWSMGFDDEVNRPSPFVGVLPVWVP